MKIFAAADLHGEMVECPVDANEILIIGDFSKGDKLRQIVFGNGNLEEAKNEVLESSKQFLSSLQRGSIIVPGNVEKLCLDQVAKIAEEYGHHFLRNTILIKNGLKILGLNFFMEEDWARKTYPDNKDKIERARREESEIRASLEENPGADIVLSHLPPYKILDKNPNPPEFLPENYPENCGSKVLLEYIEKNHPKLVFCGHIHIPGEVLVGKTRVINPGRGCLVTL